MDQTRETQLSPTQRETSRPTSDKRRALRTYSKRSRIAEDDSGSGLLKKRKVVTDHSSSTRPSDPLRIPPAHPTPPSSNIPKSSILSYFKPCRSSSATESSDPLSDSEKLVHTPPSSPPVFKKIKEPRRLRLRLSTPILLPSDKVENAKDENEEGHDTNEQGARRVLRPRRGVKGLQMVDNHEANEQKTDTETSHIVPKRPPLRSKPVATVQTTINISSKPTFMECKTCRIVYNPLHPNDVKYHSQRHAAFLRSRAKA
ncbi:hypothetical protein EsH8_VI_000966 [Colletotrichum jinshuiense]